MSSSNHSRRYDLIIIGGGIAGVGVALAASSLNKKVALIERAGIGSGTSSNSLRIIHGGFRYLQNLNLQRVVESARSRQTLLENYSDWIKPLPCVMPLSGRGLKRPFFARLGTYAYAAIHLLATGKLQLGRVMNQSELGRRVPLLSGRAPHGALYWEDAWISDLVGFQQNLKSDLEQSGVQTIEHCEVKKLVRKGSGYQVMASTAEGEVEFKARALVNTLGPWLSDLKRPVRIIGAPRPRLWCLGFNIVLNRKPPSDLGIGVEGDFDRLFFLAPRGDTLAIGTWYLDRPSEEDKLTVSSPEVREALEQVNRALPGLGAKQEDVLAIEQGRLPSNQMSSSGEPIPLGSYQIHEARGYLEVISTKYTTFLPQGRKALARVQPYLS